MFIGHFGAGLAAKGLDKRPSLGTLFLASQFIDLLWPIFLLIGLEKVKIDPGNTEFTPLNFIYYPFSHGLIGVLIWAVLFGVVYFLFKKNIKSSIILSALVFSHWILDLITHKPDLPLTFNDSTKVGFGLWNSIAVTILLEVLIFIAGAYTYLKVTKPQNASGKYVIWALLVFLIIVYIMNIEGPPPPSEKAIAYVGFAQWLIIAWGYWADKNRRN